VQKQMCGKSNISFQKLREISAYSSCDIDQGNQSMCRSFYHGWLKEVFLTQFRRILITDC